MFEGLLEKILLAKLGKFLAGLDKDSLKIALWRGDITLENVYLKPETLLMFQLPLFLSLGKIKRLVVKVPWTRLSSAPVEIFLEGLYAVVVPQPKHEWSYSEEGDILKRKDYIESHEARRRQALKQQDLSAEEEKQQKSFAERLTLKVVDNLKIHVQDIHVRFEHHIEGRCFSAGLTLQNIECFTTNSAWERSFADRSDPEIFKLLNVNGLALYWTSDDPCCISAEEDEEVQLRFMHELIHNRPDTEYIICPINAHAKIIHRVTMTTYDRPMYQVSLTLQEVFLKYKQAQFHDTVRLLEYFTEYNKFIVKAESVKKFRVFSPEEKTPLKLWKFAIHSVLKTIKQRKDRTSDYFRMSSGIKRKHEQIFKMMHRKKAKGQPLAPEELAKYDRAIYLCAMSDLTEWTNHVITVVKQEKQQSAKKSGWFGFWRQSGKDEEPSSEAYEDIFSSLEGGTSIENLPNGYVWVQFDFLLATGKMELSKLKTDLSMEFLTFTCTEFSTSVYKKIQGGDIDAKIHNFSLVTQDDSEENLICQKIRTEEDLPLCQLGLRLQPTDLDCGATLDFTSQPLEVNFSKSALKLIISFFVVPNTEESAKNAAWDTLQGLQDSTQETLMDLLYGETKYLININICGPRICLPLPNSGGSFLVNLGRFKLANTLEICEGKYEHYALQVSDLEFEYIGKVRVAVIPRFCINTQLQFMKSRYRKRKWDLKMKGLAEIPDIIIDGELPSLELSLSPSIYHQLAKIDEIFQLDEETWISMNLEKQAVLAEAKLQTLAKKQGTSLQNWHQYLVVLAKSYLYFFDLAQDTFATSYYYIKDCSIVDCSDEIGSPYTIKLSNRYGDCMLAFDSAETFSEWKATLGEEVTEIQTFSSVATKDQAGTLANAYWMWINFQVPRVSLILCNEEGLKLTEFALKQIGASAQFRPYDLSLTASLHSVSILDLNRVSSGHFSSLVVSKQDTSVIDLKIEYFGVKSPAYNNRDVVIGLQFGWVELNWNPDQLTSILNFFEFASFTDPQPKEVATGNLQPQHILLDLNISLVQLDLYMNVVESECQLAVVSFYDTTTTFIVKNGEYEWECDCRNIELFDLTNYPRTAMAEPCAPYRLFTIKEQTGSLLHFHIFIYSDDNPAKPADHGASVNVQLSSATIVYLHQPIMRIVDYFNYRMLGSFDMDARMKDANHWSPIYKLSHLLGPQKLQPSPALGPVQRSFTLIKVAIANPVVEIRPRPHYPEFFVADLGNITINNWASSSSSRHESQEIWLDIFDVDMQNITITNQQRKVAQEFNVQLHVERPVLTTEQMQLENLDQSYQIYGEIRQIQLNWTQEDFRLLMNLANLNFAYDDKLEELFNPNREVPVFSDPNHGGVFLAVKLQIHVISLLLHHEHQEVAEIVFGASNLNLSKYNDSCMDLKFSGETLLGLLSAETAGVTESEDAGFQELFSIPAECMMRFENLGSEYMRLNHILFGPLVSGYEEQVGPLFTIDLHNDNEGTKDIVIVLEQLRINSHLSVFQQIQNFFYYGFPDYTDKEDTPYDYLKADIEAFANVENFYAPRLSVNLSIAKPLLVLPTATSSRVLVGQTDVAFAYLREREVISQHGSVPAVVKRLVAHELEIYTCKLTDLSSQSSFRLVQKRKILDPTQLIYESNETRLTMNDSSFSIRYQAGALRFLVSHMDLQLLKRAIDYQSNRLLHGRELTELLMGDQRPADSEDEGEDEILLKAETESSVVDGSEALPDEEVASQRAAIPETSVLRTASEYSLAEITAVLINDAAGAYSPVLDLVVTEARACAVQTKANWTCSISVSAKSNYYNPILNQWEPLVELYSLKVEVFDFPENNPKQAVLLKTDSDYPLNINLSETMINYMLTILKTWTSSPEPGKDVREVVSPLSIRNSTGTVVLIEKNIRNSMTSPDTLLINSGETVDEEIETDVARELEPNEEIVTIYLFEGDEPSERVPPMPINKVQSKLESVRLKGRWYPVLIDIQLLETRKLLNIRSPVSVMNQTSMHIEMFLAYETNTTQLLCSPNEVTDVPITFLQGHIAFAPVGTPAEEMHYYSLQERLMGSVSLETKSGPMFLMVNSASHKVHEQRITLRSPVTYRNRLPTPLTLQLIYDTGYRTEVLTIPPGEDVKDHSNSYYGQLQASLQIPEFNPSAKLMLISKKGKLPKTTTLLDAKRNGLAIEIAYRNKGGHELIFYPTVAIVNNSDMPLTFFSKYSGMLRPVPGQNYRSTIIPCSKAKRLAVGLGARRSEGFKISAVGVQNVAQFTGERTPQNTQILYQFIYDITLTQVIPEELLFTRVVTISPRFILVNSLECDLLLKQHNSLTSHMVIPKQKRMPFHFPDLSAGDFLVEVKESHQEEWTWSGAFPISDIGTFNIQFNSLTTFNVYKLLRVDVKMMEESVFVVFEAEDDRYSTYRIVNNSSVVSLEVNQLGFEDIRQIDLNTSIAFAWSQPHRDHILVTRFFIGPITDWCDAGVQQEFNIDQINKNYKLLLRRPELFNQFVYIYLYNEGSTKVIEFSDTRNKAKAVHFETIYEHIIVQLPKVGLSLIEYYKGTPCELLYITFVDPKLEAQKTKRLWKAEFSVAHIQVDNQSAVTPVFPVVVFPDFNSQQAALQVSVSTYIDSNPNCYNFECCELLIQTLYLQMESTIVRKLLGLVSRLFFKKQAVYYSHEVFSRYVTPTWKVDQILKSNKKYYFGSLRLFPIKVVCTFLPTKDSGEAPDTVDAFATIAKALGMALIAIDSAPVKLAPVELVDCYGSDSQIISALWMHYKAQLTTELFKMIGHAAVLGNPVGLFNNLGTGVFAFFYEPAQGIIKGPVSAGKGLLKGTKTLVTNTVQGTFGTFSKLTSSLATGITTLTQGSDYNRQRQLDHALNKPRTVVDGLGMGFKSLFTNIGKGFTGIFTEPINGYKKNKVKGMLVGGARGVSGIFVKPVAGVLDAASMTAEGIKNTASKQDSELKRQRPPRPFYGVYGVSKPYNDHDAQVLLFISKLKKGLYAKEQFVGQCVSKELRGQVWLVGIFMRVIIVADVRTHKIVWVVDTRSIRAYEAVNQGIRILTWPSQYKETRNKEAFLIPFTDPAAIRHLLKKIQSVVEHLK